MRLLPGRLFPTLSYKVDKEIKETLYKNDAFLNSRWSFLEKSIVQWSTPTGNRVWAAGENCTATVAVSSKRGFSPQSLDTNEKVVKVESKEELELH